MCKPVIEHTVNPHSISSCYVLIEQLIVSDTVSYKSINHQEYINKKQKKLEQMKAEKKHNDTVSEHMLEAEEHLISQLQDNLKSKIFN